MHPLNPSQVNPSKANGTDANRDALSGAPGAHPVGVGVGAIGAGAAVGAAGGMIAGPLGAAAGAAIGAVVGGLAGKAAAEVVNPTVETKYWQETYPSRPYARPDASYDEFAPAYRYGWESVDRRGKEGQTFESVEADLQRGWEQARGTSRLGWDKAKEASRDAWNRVQRPAAGTNARSGG